MSPNNMSKEDMKQDKPLKEELEAISPVLAEMEGKESFRTPTGYFSDLPDRTIGRLKQVEIKRHPVNTGERNLRVSFRKVLQPQYILAYAATLTLLLVIVFLVRNNGSKRQFAEITTEEAYQYIATNINDYDTDELFATLGQGDEAMILPTLEEHEEDVLYNMILKDIDVEDLEIIMEEL